MQHFQVIDPKAFRSGGAFATDLYIVGGGFALLIGLLILYGVFRSVRNRLMSRRLKLYKQKKLLSKMSALNMSEDAADSLSLIGKMTGHKVDELLSDNREFEKALNQIKAATPNNPLLSLAQPIREQADFVFGNPKVHFVVSQMLEVGQEVRVFVTHQGRQHSFVTRLLRVTNSELWLRPPKVKGKVVKLTAFKRFELRVYRPQDGEYHMFCDLKRQINKPVHALILKHAVQVMRMNHRKHERVAVEIDRQIAYIVPKQSSQFTFGEMEAVPNTVTIADLSSGGMRIITEGLHDAVEVGTEVVTKLPETGIRKKIRSHIVRIDKEPDSNVIYVHLMFANLTERDRHLLEKFVHSLNTGKKAAKPKKIKMPSKISEKLSPPKPTEGLATAADHAQTNGHDDAAPAAQDLGSAEVDEEALDDVLDVDKVLSEAKKSREPAKEIKREEASAPKSPQKGDDQAPGAPKDAETPQDDLDLDEDDGMHFDPEEKDETK